MEEMKEVIETLKQMTLEENQQASGGNESTVEETKENMYIRRERVYPDIPRQVGFAFDNFMLLHENFKRDHPERPARLMSIYTHLEKTQILKQLPKIEFESVDEKYLKMTHDQSLINTVDLSIYNSKELRRGNEVPKLAKETHYIDNDVYVNKYTKECAYLAAGASVEACKQVYSQEGQMDAAFAAIRPPGHHASCEKISGFCLFNNVVVAAKYLQSELGMKKICIFDWDIHCGDGTSQILYQDDSVLYISLHRYDDGMFYPGKAGSPDLIGEEKGKGFNIHFAFSAYSNKNISDMEYIYACTDLLFPIIKEFGPEAILISCGFDSAKGDPLGGIGVTPLGYSWMTYGLMKICPDIVVLLEGGYNLDALALSSEAVISTLRIDPNDQESFDKYIEKRWSSEQTFNQLSEKSLQKAAKEFREPNAYLRKLLQPFWKCLQPESAK
ncbi:histone deacetylase family protein [Stylonychia lemnae]|uniref:histone deacetylase n=1 Tax=Stylonychia lemnae TaxID=5949 RepID=A0A077ZVJ9_STYLE|nr:histone deacetylase family protein [Stylonychia lemnae]|eukprot:CDW73889.1 histone deacetylase family protein [Stylonychia lemnae]